MRKSLLFVCLIWLPILAASQTIWDTLETQGTKLLHACLLRESIPWKGETNCLQKTWEKKFKGKMYFRFEPILDDERQFRIHLVFKGRKIRMISISSQKDIIVFCPEVSSQVLENNDTGGFVISEYLEKFTPATKTNAMMFWSRTKLLVQSLLRKDPEEKETFSRFK